MRLLTFVFIKSYSDCVLLEALKARLLKIIWTVSYYSLLELDLIFGSSGDGELKTEVTWIVFRFLSVALGLKLELNLLWATSKLILLFDIAFSDKLKCVYT